MRQPSTAGGRRGQLMYWLPLTSMTFPARSGMAMAVQSSLFLCRRGRLDRDRLPGLEDQRGCETDRIAGPRDGDRAPRDGGANRARFQAAEAELCEREPAAEHRYLRRPRVAAISSPGRA